MSNSKDTGKKMSPLRILAVSAAAIIFVPVLYSGIYLCAFWNPYGRFSNVPVAFVNLDKAVVKDGTEYNLGKNIEDNLKKNSSVGWRFTSLEEAKRGVRNADYYAYIVIPEDFSAKLSASTDGPPVRPVITYEANMGKNFIFAQISERAAETIRSEVASSIQAETTRALAGSLYDIKASVFDASNGAASLHSGTLELVNGSKQLSAELASAAGGSKALQDGLRQAAAGESQLSGGIDSLITGLTQFRDSFSQNTNNTAPLAAGAKSLSDGISVLSGKLNEANLSQSLTGAADGIGNIRSALDQVSSLLASYSGQANIDSAKAIVAQLTGSLDSQNLEGQLRSAAASTGDLSTNMASLNAGAVELSGGISTLSETLTVAQNNAAAGANQLLYGAGKIKTGNTDLVNGLSSAVDRCGDLYSGLTALNNGAASLNSGIILVNDGSAKLMSGLGSGYKRINSGLKFSVEDISSFITNPLTLSDISINRVRYYGEGLAPYFISLSLWLGAMLMNLVITAARLTKTIPYKFMKTYTGTFAAGCILVMLQALILSLVLVLGLGLEASNMLLFFLGTMFIAVVFFSIMYGASRAVGFIATPMIFVLFILQLASSGGTFPIETAPRFFRILSPIFPMTYSVEGLRMITGGIYASRLLGVSVILLAFLLIFYALGFVINRTFKGL
ncbi:MAG: YhgE/Pip domain-containing protein [Bacillota bacterium]|nr:YhgE/Pip domain-containing protein [Bacillota bacterium]